MKKLISAILLNTCMASCSFAQFAPPAGQPGTTAIENDSSVFVGWATGCSVTRGLQDVSNPSLGYAISGDSTMATGMAGTNGVVSLGDGGYAIMTFAHPITDGAGWDFAVFENGFSDIFLELAFVEVSSDGINYFRFPCTSNTQNAIQIDGFGSIDATQIDNLAGKYRALFGTPFDLQQLAGQAGLNINAVTHVKIIDVVGCIQPAYASYDQYGNIINDPWNTAFASSGFDLDAVGVINNVTTGLNSNTAKNNFSIYPNPAKGTAFLESGNGTLLNSIISIADYTGKKIKSIQASNDPLNAISLNVSDLKTGVYFITASNSSGTFTQKLMVSNE